MGQQQLLLLVLGIVIVGLAVVVGIQAFNENQRKANADALVSDAIRIGSDIQAWKLKPKAFGGGAEATNWTGITFDQLGYETGDQTYNTPTATSSEYENLNGIFALASQTSSTMTITGTSYETGTSTQLNQVVLSLSGTTPAGMSTAIN